MAGLEHIGFSEANFNTLVQQVKELIQDSTRLKEENAFLKEENAHQKEQIKVLEARLNQDSHNSSKPPSSDGFKKKIVNLRKKTGRKPGGQPGHSGTTLKMSSQVDEVIWHRPIRACSCDQAYKEEGPIQARQVFDLPTVKMKVEEHRQTSFRCNRCGRHFQGEFPATVTHPVQYGKGIQSLATYLNHYHFIPYARVKELFSECYDVSLSTGTLVNFTRKAKNRLAGFEAQLKERALSEKLLHVDETGMRCKGKTHWVHTVSNEKFSYYGFNAHRGRQAIDQMDLLPRYTGRLVHDRFGAYFHYKNSEHSLCNAHLLRDLIYVNEQENGDWAGQLITLLVKAKDKKQAVQSLSQVFKSRVKNQYRHIVRHTLLEQEKVFKQSHPSTKCRGKPKRSKAHNLLIALNKHNRAILAFLDQDYIPFDNNQAERDIRMVKTKQKVSGCFRTTFGAEAFCRIRSYMATLRKNQKNILQGIQNAINNQSFSPFDIAE